MTDDTYPRVCILTGAPDEDPEDCTTHDHECDGDHIERPHRFWTYSGKYAPVCQRSGCNVMGTGDRCGDGECEGSPMSDERTIDNHALKLGDRVWDYDLRVAVVGPVHHYEVGTPWYTTTREDGSRGKDFDAKRMWWRHPTDGRLA